MKKDKTGIVHGRFQPFHLGHLEYVKMALSRCEFLYIGIANPDPSLTLPHKANTQRAERSSNPFTYFERLSMIKTTLAKHGYSTAKYEIVPFPINYPEFIEYYVPIDATFYITIYDEWGYAKKDALLKQGFKVHVLEEGGKSLKVAEGTRIRDNMMNGTVWYQDVPYEVKAYIEDHGLVEKRILNHGENA
jgi:cytidyltransferase-like protein